MAAAESGPPEAIQGVLGMLQQPNRQQEHHDDRYRSPFQLEPVER